MTVVIDLVLITKQLSITVMSTQTSPENIHLGHDRGSTIITNCYQFVTIHYYYNKLIWVVGCGSWVVVGVILLNTIVTILPFCLSPSARLIMSEKSLTHGL